MPYLRTRIKPDKPNIKMEQIELPEDITEWLHEVRNIIGCSTIQIVNTRIQDIVLIIDDAGKLKPDWEKNFNLVATVLYGEFRDIIVGDAVIGRRFFDEIIPLTKDDIRVVKRIFDIALRDFGKKPSFLD